MKKEQRRAPVLRFKGFTDDWEQRKLGEIVNFSKGIGYSKADLKKEGVPIILYGRLYTNYEMVITDVDTYTFSKIGSVYSNGGEVIVPASGETAEDISIASVVEKSGILLGGDLNIITPLSEIDSVFLAISISNGKAHKDMAKMAQGKSIVHLHNSDLEKIDLNYPYRKEQTKISVFFRKFDHLITLHQRKLESLEKIKSRYLQCLFPEKKQTNPIIRFSGFNTNWEQRKLGDVCIINNGKDYKHLNKGTIPVYGTGGVLTKVNSALSYDKDAVGIGRKGTINKPFILNAPFWTVDTLFYVIPNKYISLYFLFILFQQIKWNKLDESTGVPSLSKENIKVVNIKLPSKSEMIKISKFIFLLDKKIELHQSKLEALKKIKSIYLRYLFPEKG